METSIPPKDPTRADDGSQVLDGPGPLSASRLWGLQRDFYERESTDVWQRRGLPSYITSNPSMAHACARVVAGFLHDLSVKKMSAGSWDEAMEPIPIVEMGSGLGRFAFHFLDSLCQLLPGAGSGRPGATRDFLYVLTDISEATLDFWQRHPSLQRFVTAGVLDFALFEVGGEEAPRTVRGGRELGVDALHTPLVVIANYFFDCLPQDVFFVSRERLFECRTTVHGPDPSTSPDSLRDFRLSYEKVPVEDGYYGDPRLDALLDEYRRSLRDSYLLFPTTGFHCLDAWSRWSDSGPTLVLANDLGWSRIEDLRLPYPPELGHGHDSFWLPVNFHALGRFVEEQDGTVLPAPRYHDRLSANAFLLPSPGRTVAELPETRVAHTNAFRVFGPDAFFRLREMLAQNVGSMALPEILSVLDLCRWEQDMATSCAGRLAELVEEGLSTAAEDALRQGLWHLQQHRFVLDPEGEASDPLAELERRLGTDRRIAYPGG